MKTSESERLTKLDKMLMQVEIELLRKKIDRQDDTIDSALDIINTAAENGSIEIDGCCDDDSSSGEDFDDNGGEDED